MDLEKMLRKGAEKGLTFEEYSRMISESIAQNITPMINVVDDPNSPKALAMGEYIKAHCLLPQNYEKVPVDEIVKKGRLLCSKKTRHDKKKKIIMLLAHHGSQESLEALKRYQKNQDEELSVWVEMAIDECRVFLDKKKAA